MKYVQIVSWHRILTPTRQFDTYRTLCGRTVQTDQVVDDLPFDERTCERCLQIAVRREDLADDD